MRIAQPLLAALVGLMASSALAQAPTFASITLGAASNLTMFNMGATQMSASNSGTLFEGNIGLASGASTNFSGGGTMTGTLYKDPGATVQASVLTQPSSQFHVNGGIVTQSMAQAVTDVRTASHDAALLAATQSWSGNLTNGHTFTSTGQFNVIDIGGSITVTNPSKNVTFAGGVNDWFIINVHGGITVSNGSIGLSGGLLSDHVLVNVLGSNPNGADGLDYVKLSNAQSSLYGTYLDVDGKISLTPGTVYGAIMAKQIQTSSGPKVYEHIYTPPTTPIPEPETYAMLLAGLGLLGFAARRRRQSAR